MINLFTQISGNSISFGQKVKRNVNSAELTNPLTQPANNDNFVKKEISTSQIEEPKKVRGKTKRGRFLKEIKREVGDPYSNAITLREEDFERYKKFVTPIENPYNRTLNMSRYSRNMRPVEREVFVDLSKRLRQFEKTKQPWETLTFSDILKEEKPRAIKRLTIKEYVTLQEIKDKAQEMPKKEGKKVLKEVKAALALLENPKQRFYRRDFIQSLIDLRDNNPNSKDLKEIVSLAYQLPTSLNDKDAFIAQYANSTDEEITNRLVSYSVRNLEHLKAKKDGGADEAFNLLMTTYGSNIERDSMDFETFKELHPNLSQFTQSHINDIIDAIHEGELKGYEWYPYVVAPSIEEEMGIKIDLSAYKIKPKKALKHLPERLQPYFPQFEQYFNKIKK